MTTPGQHVELPAPSQTPPTRNVFTMPLGVTEANKAIYQTSDIVNKYIDKPSLLRAPEEYCIDRIPMEARGRILDIGIGAGRTSGPLSEIFASYIGIDYSPDMIEAAKTKYPDLDLRVMDASNLAFDEEFDVVMFSFNGIDCVDTPTRFAIQTEMVRVLRPGGYMIYSTHNLHFRRVSAWLKSPWVHELGVRDRGDLRKILNRIRHYSAGRDANEHGIAFINDPGEAFGVVLAYADIPRELARLAALGMSIDTTIGNTQTTSTYDANDNWVHILARKQ